MRILTPITASCWLALTFCLSGPSSAQQWAEKMFNKLEHDFGTVARGAETVYRFEITNIYKQPMQINGVRSSCGCTTSTIENSTIKSHETAYIAAKFNTHSTFIGRHGATLTISFAPPFRAEVQVRVHGNIRSDVVFSPGAVQFGDVDQGTTNDKLLSVDYAGRDTWKIVDVTNDNDHFEVELQETSRGNGKVSYNLLIRLMDNVTVGYVKDQLTVITNDQIAEKQRIPLFVEGRVIPEFSVTPAALVLGDVVPGEPVTRKVVVSSKKPFRIVDVDCGDDCFTFKTDQKSKNVHLVEIKYVPDNLPGPVKIPIRITTDRGKNRGAALTVSATVIAPAVVPDRQADATTQPGVLAESGIGHGTASKLLPGGRRPAVRVYTAPGEMSALTAADWL